MSSIARLTALAASGSASERAAALRLLARMSRAPSDSNYSQDGEESKSSADKEAETANQEDGLDDEQEITYTAYKPKKLKYGCDHPDPVVENSTLASVEPPDITYNLVMPADIISEGKLSNLQLEAIVYGCQRHMQDLPKAPGSSLVTAPVSEKENLQSVKPNLNEVKPDMDLPQDIGETPAVRAGFLLGDGAGMGKGRTLAGFVVENIARGRKKHIWISVSSDLYEDAKRDLSDLGLSDYAEKKCFNLGKLPYSSLVSGSSSSKSKRKTKNAKGKKSKQPTYGTYDEGVMFATYSTLVGKNNNGESRLEQLLEWCGEDFDGLIMLDECHKAKVSLFFSFALICGDNVLLTSLCNSLLPLRLLT